jgi:DtxR family transcriptional regulator, Mn-dependent transcriptional regulator
MLNITHLSKSTGDYLKGLYALDSGEEPVSTNGLAEYLEVSPASVTNKLQKLASEEPVLVTYTKHYGAKLTPTGRAAALRLVRRHRLIEFFLAQVLGYTWDELHAEAEELEHVITQRFEDRLAERLGEPSYDPHGDPIPDRDLNIPNEHSILLNGLPPGQPAVIRRVAGRRPEVLQHLGGLGLIPGANLTVIERNPLDQTIQVRIGEGGGTVLGPVLANEIWVEQI